MASGKRTPEYHKIQHNYANIRSTLTNLVPPEDLGNKLFAAALVGHEVRLTTYRLSISEQKKIDILLAAVTDQIELNPANFYKFIKILEEYMVLEELLKTLRCKQISRFFT